MAYYAGINSNFIADTSKNIVQNIFDVAHLTDYIEKCSHTRFFLFQMFTFIYVFDTSQHFPLTFESAGLNDRRFFGRPTSDETIDI